MAESTEALSLQARLTRGRRPSQPRPIRRRGRRTGGLRRPRGRGRGVPPAVARRLQRSAVKASYARNGRGASWGAHGAYLAREGAQREGAKGVGFDAERDDVDLAATLQGWQEAGDHRLWKFIVSPEHGERLDLHAHTRALVAQMERDLGTPLEWASIDHHNTDNAHVHLIVRGRNAAGEPLEIDRSYLTTGLRGRSQELATRVLGLRSEREHVATRGQTVERMQFTEIDRALVRRADADRFVSYEGPRPRTPQGQEMRVQEMRRLQFLDRLGLAEKVGSRTWRLAPEMETALRQAQLTSDIIKSRARHLPLLADRHQPLVVTRLDAGVSVTGRLIGTGLADELRDQRYLLLQGADRRLHYIPQPPAVEWARGAGRLRIGDTVTLSGHAIERGGRPMVQTRIDVHTVAAGTNGQPERARAMPGAEGLPRLRRIERTLGRTITVVPPTEGLIYRGQMVAYARGDDGHRYAVVNTGRDLSAFRTPDADLAPGHDIRAQAQHADDDRRRRLVWRLGDDERQQKRERAK
jgi:type IV secretory pathway VirD2 relaxase